MGILPRLFSADYRPKKRKRPDWAAFKQNRAWRIYLDAGASVEAGFLLLFLGDDFLLLFLAALVL